MQRAAQVLPLAALAASVVAQSTATFIGSDPNVEGITTITYSICPTAATLAITSSSTLTLCPGENSNGGTPSITLRSSKGDIYESGYTTLRPNGGSTVYDTCYPATCSTGLADVTYMITEACRCEATRASDDVPSGFSTSAASILTKTCDACEEIETTMALATSCANGTYATAGGVNTGGAPRATGAAPAESVMGAGTTGTALAGGNSGAGATGGTGSNSTVSPPITPVGGNVTSAVGQNPITFTGAALKIALWSSLPAPHSQFLLVLLLCVCNEL